MRSKYNRTKPRCTELGRNVFQNHDDHSPRQRAVVLLWMIQNNHWLRAEPPVGGLAATYVSSTPQACWLLQYDVQC